MPLYHFSDESDITRFEPRSPLAHPEVEPLVWAIDALHAPMYYVPRDCPRACFWPGPRTTAADRERWFAGVDAKMVIAIEAAWLAAVRGTTLYRYTMPEHSFERRDSEGGSWVSHQPVVPEAVEPMTDLLAALIDAGVELRVTPSLVGLWREIIQSTLSFSGTRLRNASGFTPDVVREMEKLVVAAGGRTTP